MTTNQPQRGDAERAAVRNWTDDEYLDAMDTAHKYVEALAKNADTPPDAMVGFAPLWHGHAVRDAWLAGWRAARSHPAPVPPAVADVVEAARCVYNFPSATALRGLAAALAKLDKENTGK